MKLTGRKRYRAGLFGRIILEVEYEWRGMPAYSRDVCVELRWRDARTSDFVSGGLSILPPSDGEAAA